MGKLLPLAQLWLADLIAGKRELPGHDALEDNCEFAGMVHDLSVSTLLAAYRARALSVGPFRSAEMDVASERCVLFFDEFHVLETAAQHHASRQVRVTFDRDFESVIKACAGRREGRWHLTWITPRMMRAYARCMTRAMSIPSRCGTRDGALVGGGYGVALGGMFVIELQFLREPNTSKLGFSVLDWHLAKWGFLLCDNKWQTPTTSQMGFRLIPRSQFLEHLAVSAEGAGRRGRWEPETGPETVAGWRAGTPELRGRVSEALLRLQRWPTALVNWLDVYGFGRNSLPATLGDRISPPVVYRTPRLGLSSTAFSANSRPARFSPRRLMSVNSTSTS